MRRHLCKVGRAFLVLLFLGCCSSLAMAQTQTVAISGVVALEECENPTQAVFFVFFPADSSPVFVRTARLNADGSFQLDGIPRNRYHVWVKGSKWLSQSCFCDTLAGKVTDFTAWLRGGDANNDNRVDMADLADLILAFNHAAGEPEYNPDADFNCDEVVDAFDLAILIDNFRMVGEL